MKHNGTTSVLVKAGTFSMVMAIGAAGLFITPRAAFAHGEGVNDTAIVSEGKSASIQRFTTPATAKLAVLDRGSYSVTNAAEEKRQAELASLDSQSSFLEVTQESFALHDKNDGSVIYPVTTWYFDGGASGYHTSERPSHNGIDFPISSGTNIYSIADGEVIKNIYDAGGYGNHVVIRHEIGGKVVETTYGHMVELSPLVVGEKVTKGEIIGHVGSTGRSTGPHLHFEVTVDGVNQDPASWLELNAIR
jgi:murein DD-endopeptidase MepM/ murein hydrolase activator NlpD